MSVETRLRAAMADAVAPTAPDTDHLVAVARRRGLGIRRRRQALGAVGVAAALGLAVLVPSVVAGDHGSNATAAGSVAVGTEQEAFDPAQTSPSTGRSTAAALLYAVGAELRGSATTFRGQGDERPGGNTYAVFRLTPEGSTTAGEVGVNVQRFGGGTKGPGDDLADKVGRCDSWMAHCTATTLADGSRLITYDNRSVYTDRSGIRRVADLYRTDHVRILASASNGADVTERDEMITRAEPVLTTDQLVAVVTQPWWGARLPAYFTDQGNRLPDYDEIGGAADEPTPAPSSSKP